TELSGPGGGGAGGPRERLRRLALVHLVQLGRVDPEIHTVGHDLLRRGALVVPAELTALLEGDRALGLAVLAQAVCVRDLGELGLEVVDAAVGRFDPRDDFVERLRGGGRGRGDQRRREREQEEGAPSHRPCLARYSGPTRISRGLAPCPGPMMWSCSIMSMKRAALGSPRARRLWRKEREAPRVRLS